MSMVDLVGQAVRLPAAVELFQLFKYLETACLTKAMQSPGSYG
jgi:hypothetical protein